MRLIVNYGNTCGQSEANQGNTINIKMSSPLFGKNKAETEARAQVAAEERAKAAAVAIEKAAAEAEVRAKAEAEAALIVKLAAEAEAEVRAKAEAEENRPVAKLVVTKKSNGKYQLSISSNFYEEIFYISTTRKGSKTVFYKVETDKSGEYSITTSQKLSGFTLKVAYHDEDGNSYVLDTVKVK